MTSLNIALDFDDTFTADPALWSTFITNARAAGHYVFIITCRRNTLENHELIQRHLDQHHATASIICTDLAPKQHTVDARKLRIDIWIDDMPSSIFHGR